MNPKLAKRNLPWFISRAPALVPNRRPNLVLAVNPIMAMGIILSWIACTTIAAAAAYAVDRPQIVILYDPSEPRVPAMNDLAKEEIVRQLERNGFNVAEHGTAKRLRRETRRLLRFESADNVAARLSLRHNAEVVLLYRLAVKPAASGIFEQVDSTVRVRAIATKNAQLLAELTDTATGVGKTRDLAVADAIKRGTAAVANPISRRIAAWWTSFVKEGISYTVILESDPKDRLEPKFTHRLGSLKGIVFLNLRACGGQFCEYRVLYQGTSARLRHALVQTLARDREFDRLSTNSVGDNNLLFSVLDQ